MLEFLNFNEITEKKIILIDFVVGGYQLLVSSLFY